MVIYLIEIIKNEQALPSLLGVFANIVYFVRRGLVSNVARLATRIPGKVLDIGFSCKTYEILLAKIFPNNKHFHLNKLIRTI